MKEFLAIDIYSGDAHNIAVSEDSSLYNWGGTVIN